MMRMRLSDERQLQRLALNSTEPGERSVTASELPTYDGSVFPDLED